jgi:hypothetical protein
MNSMAPVLAIIGMVASVVDPDERSSPLERFINHRNRAEPGRFPT